MCAASQSGPSRQRHPRLEAHPVRLDVRLVHHIEAVLVGQLVPARHIRVVGGAHRVDVELLHQADVGDHRGFVHHVRPLGIVLVPVDAPQHDGLPVNGEDAIGDIDPAEADPRGYDLGHLPLGVHERHHQLVERRRLGSPLQRFRHQNAVHRRGLATRRHLQRQHTRFRPYRTPVRIQQLVADLVGSARTQPAIRQAHRQPQESVLVTVVQCRFSEKVTDVRRGPRHQVHVAVDPADPPEVLALQVAAIAPAVDLNRDHVGPRPDRLRDPEFGRRTASLAVPDPLPVHPHEERRIDPVEVQEDLAPVPVRRDLDRAPIRPHRVVVVGDEGRVRREGVELVAVDRVAVPLELPVAGDGDLVPPGRVEVHLEEVRRPLIGPGHPVELPSAIQADPERRILGPTLYRFRNRRKRCERSPRRFLVLGEDRGVFPVGERFGLLSTGQGRGRDEQRTDPGTEKDRGWVRGSFTALQPHGFTECAPSGHRLFVDDADQVALLSKDLDRIGHEPNASGFSSGSCYSSRYRA